MTGKRILVFQHIACEHPGVFRDFMDADGIGWDAVELDEGESIPDLSGYDAVISMGGPMDVWQEAEHPWLRQEKDAIREAVAERGMPFLGVCLGHQLLADALGGEVGPSNTPEVGMLDVELASDFRRHQFVRDLPESFKSLQWHSAEIKRLPENAAALMSSPLCAVQAMAVGDSAFSIQFHVETGPQTIDEWNAVPEYEKALAATFGPGGADRLRAQSEAHQSSMAQVAKTLYRNWAATI